MPIKENKRYIIWSQKYEVIIPLVISYHNNCENLHVTSRIFGFPMCNSSFFLIYVTLLVCLIYISCNGDKILIF